MLFFCNITDDVGSLCGVGNIEIVGAGWKKRDIKVLTDQQVEQNLELINKTTTTKGIRSVHLHYTH